MNVARGTEERSIVAHRWTPRDVIEWHRGAYPGDESPAERTLYRFLSGQTKEWFLEELFVHQVGKTRLPRILVLETEAMLIEMQKLRVSQALAAERQMNGLLYPELRANVELLHRMLRDHLIAQQELGLEPKVTAADRSADDLGSAHHDKELAQVIGRLLNLPSEEFMAALPSLLGPPPVKQPLKIEGPVIESRPMSQEGET